MLSFLKKLFSKSDKDEEYVPRFPQRWFSIRWAEYARKKGVGGSRNKQIALMEGGSISQKLPYNKHIVEALVDVMSTPHLDETGGHVSPTYDELANYMPNAIAWDHDALRDIT